MNLDFIIEAIRYNKNLNTTYNLTFPCSICSRNVLTLGIPKTPLGVLTS